MGLARATVAMVLVAVAWSSALAGEASESLTAKALPTGRAFPDLALTGKLTGEQAADLGLASDTTPVSLNAIKAEVLVVEVFSMYCPHCQGEAPEVNALAALVSRRGLDNRIKIIGLGVGNSEAEVEIFRQKYRIPFPLFADAQFVAHKAVGEVGTPYFYVLGRKPGQKNFTVLEGTLGRLDSPEAFLRGIVRQAGL
jgi:peroxiredoxin